MIVVLLHSVVKASIGQEAASMRQGWRRQDRSAVILLLCSTASWTLGPDGEALLGGAEGWRDANQLLHVRVLTPWSHHRPRPKQFPPLKGIHPMRLLSRGSSQP
ncbi:hypothetical protein ZWY2020_032833 [Hordeum vulgare]|nr:hypothetical protein ZWY2020_032833 [Hordeum vulgare]